VSGPVDAVYSPALWMEGIVRALQAGAGVHGGPYDMYSPWLVILLNLLPVFVRQILQLCTVDRFCAVL